MKNDHELIAAAALASGSTITLAARLAGVTERTIYRLRRRTGFVALVEKLASVNRTVLGRAVSPLVSRGLKGKAMNDLPPRRTGPTPLTVDLIEKARAVFASGLSLHSGAALLDVPFATFRRWLRAARKIERRLEDTGGVATGKEQLLLDLAWAIRTAMARLEAETLEKVRTAADDGDVEAAKWLLERRFPSGWAPGRMELRAHRRQRRRERGY